ncbi:MAG: Nif3-like dinuclear metal center hexameric protein, partial [Proteobacteria bacterium]|nr:Nif3-like dinuclear metal center hexameric protein [Pseudomonadota bacterium]
MGYKVSDITSYLEKNMPLYCAEPWDPVGLSLGRGDMKVEEVLCTVTVTTPVAQEALSQKNTLICSHHPFPFRADLADHEQHILTQLTDSQIAVYSAHTAYDNAPGGINDTLLWVAQGLGLGAKDIG